MDIEVAITASQSGVVPKGEEVQISPEAGPCCSPLKTSQAETAETGLEALSDSSSKSRKEKNHDIMIMTMILFLRQLPPARWTSSLRPTQAPKQGPG